METDRIAAELLHTIGMSPKYKGYAYSHYALALSILDMTRTHNMSANLYKMICEHYQVSSYIVERNIRFAIKRAWEDDFTGNMHRLFQSYGVDYVPTNREFICILTDCIRHNPTATNLTIRLR